MLPTNVKINTQSLNYSTAIDVVQEIIYRFIEYSNEFNGVNDINTFSTSIHEIWDMISNFRELVGDKVKTKSSYIFNTEMSGIELNFTLEITNKTICN